jgi:hypothetical protein
MKWSWWKNSTNFLTSKYYANGSVPSNRRKGSFWWRDLLKLLDKYKGIFQVHLGSGDTILFWKDMWNGQLLNQSFPHLYYFAENATVKAILSSPNLHDNLHQPLSKEAYEEFCDLSIYLQFIKISEDKDKWSYIWGSAEYVPKKSLQTPNWIIPSSSSLWLDLEFLLSNETQGFLLATLAKQIEHKINAKEKTYGSGFICMWALLKTSGGIKHAFILKMFLCKKIVGLKLGWQFQLG